MARFLENVDQVRRIISYYCQTINTQTIANARVRKADGSIRLSIDVQKASGSISLSTDVKKANGSISLLTDVKKDNGSISLSTDVKKNYVIF